jgi:predicted acyltransferase (DUF342 family)
MSISRRLLSILAIPLLTILFGIAATKPVNAAEFHFKDYTLNQDQTVSDDLYITNSYTEINGLVQGDLMIVATDVKITGTITGDVYVVGSNITFTGNTYGNLVAVGNDISIQGIIKANAYTIGSLVNFSGNVEKDYANIAMRTSLTGSVGDDARFITSDGTIDTLIKGDLIVLGSKYSLQEEKVTGNIYDSSRLDSIAKDQGVLLDREANTPKTYSFNWTDKLFGALFAFCSLSLVGYVMIASAPVKTGKIMSKITGSPKDFIFSLLIGFGILVVAPVALLLLSISLVGLPLAFFVFGLILFLTIFGQLWVETAFGQEILHLLKSEGYRPFKSLAIGRLISVLIGLVPFVGFFYSVALMSTAVGAFVRMKLEAWNKGKKK